MSDEVQMQQWIASNIPSQWGRRVIVTGATSGIGWDTARALARAGAAVVMTARNHEKGRDAVERIRSTIPSAQVRSSILDLSSLRSVREFADRECGEPLDLLINNAGTMATKRRELTVDGFERTLGTNYLGPFALTGLMLPALLRSSNPRVITIASAAARQGKIDLDDLEGQKRYGLNAAYARSKLADLIFALELQRRIESNGVRLMSVACHPGYAITNLQNSELTFGIRLVAAVLKPWASHDAAHGALPTLFAATSTRAESGAYYGPDGILEAKGWPAPAQIPQRATDHALARGLWEISGKLTGVQYDALIGLR